jgi:hypothetical protein
MTSKSQSAAALGDVRATSYDEATANPDGYQGSLDDALEQVRMELDPIAPYWPLNMSRSRFELLKFLGVTRPKFMMSGQQQSPAHERVLREVLGQIDRRGRIEDDSVVYYGANGALLSEKNAFSLEYALKNWPENFKSGDAS